ncbi:hypothetical protein [Flavobacterium sp. KJJ]|uniref:hypothetical protein n=1 Tax=Flavobacterium sp. KJJ TaxID=1270193 RepID=UPI0004939E6D|nr:hypothetical protein [Flavobacterium sp. KJJ]
MDIKNNDLKIIIPFLLLVAVGIYGMYSCSYISVSITFKFVRKYFLVPLLLYSFFYAYNGVFRSHKKTLLWKSIILFILLTIMIGMITFVSLQGISILVNKEFGKQYKYKLSGKIIKLNYPANKKIGNNYSIYIKRDIEKDTIELIVPRNAYLVGQKITKEMKIGLLKFVYSND